MLERPDISFFCPVHNEEGNLERTVANFAEALQRYAGAFEIVIIDDGSSDATGRIADRLAERNDLVKVVHHPASRGYGAALRSGFAHATRYGHVFYTDGDGQFNGSDLGELLRVADGTNVVVGYRLRRRDGLHRKVQSWVYRTLVGTVFGMQVRDVNCSMKLIPRRALDAIDLRSDSFFIDAELLLRLRDAGFRIDEVGVHHFPRRAGRSSGTNLRFIVATIREAVRHRMQNRGR